MHPEKRKMNWFSWGIMMLLIINFLTIVVNAWRWTRELQQFSLNFILKSSETWVELLEALFTPVFMSCLPLLIYRHLPCKPVIINKACPCGWILLGSYLTIFCGKLLWCLCHFHFCFILEFLWELMVVLFGASRLQ